MSTNTSAPSLDLSRLFAFFRKFRMRASSRIHRYLRLWGEMMLRCSLVGHVSVRWEPSLLLLVHREIFDSANDMLGLIVVSWLSWFSDCRLLVVRVGVPSLL